MEKNKKYRLIAIDLDGTLLDARGDVTPRTKAAVHKCLSAGLLVCFATGRNWTESQTVLETVEHYDTAVFVGGAMVVDTKHRVTMHRTLMDADLARRVCKLMEARNQTPLALQDTHSAGGVDYLVSEGCQLHPTTARWMEGFKSAMRTVPSLQTHSHEHTIRVGIVADTQVCAEMMVALNEQFGERIFVHALRVPGSTLDILEVFDPAVNKWEGILHVARHHGVDRSEIICIGDELNDLPMIQNAGLGVAMGNANEKVRSVAKRVIGSHAEDGLAIFLEELVSEHIVKPAS